MRHHAHLLEERLFDVYLAERGGESIDPRLAEHLVDCQPCATRYADLAGFMDGLHAEGIAEADAAFGADRLRAQQVQIARRLELAGHPARVISFPRRFARGTMTRASSHGAPRWIAAAAAAGLFIGVAVGASYNYGSHRSLADQVMARQTYGNVSSRNPLSASSPASSANRSNSSNLNPATPLTPLDSTSLGSPVATGGSGSVPGASDDAFLSDLEVALERPHTRELQAFDALTPHVREVGLRR